MNMSADAEKPATKVLLALLSGCAAAIPLHLHANEAAPDMELLEYLGSWEESDEDWVLFEADDEQAGQQETRSDPVAEGEESQESQHES